MINKYIQELQDFELVNHDNGTYTDLMPVSAAIDILQRFEVDLINSMDCEKLENLKTVNLNYGYKQVSKEQGVTS